MTATIDSPTIGSSHAKGRSRDLGDAAEGCARAAIFPAAPAFDRLFCGFFFLLNVQLFRIILWAVAGDRI